MIECVPTAKAEVVNVATPPLTAPEPIKVMPLENFTVPVGAPDAAVTVAVKVTSSPYVEGFGEEVIAVVVLFTMLKLLETGSFDVAGDIGTVELDRVISGSRYNKRRE